MKRKNIISILVLLFTIGSLESCLKDTKAPITNSEDTHNIIEFGDTGPIESPSGAVYPLYSPIIEDFVNDTTGFYINIGYSGADYASTDIYVKLKVDTAAIALYNVEQGTNYKMLPDGTYSFPDSLIINKGFNGLKHLRGIIKSNSDLLKNVDYALPLKIDSVSSGVISGNFGTAIYSFSF